MFYGVIIKDIPLKKYTIHSVFLGDRAGSYDEEQLCKFRSRWDKLFDEEQEMRMDRRNCFRGKPTPLPVATILFSAPAECECKQNYEHTLQDVLEHFSADNHLNGLSVIRGSEEGIDFFFETSDLFQKAVANLACM